jgi:hypothetical protein
MENRSYGIKSDDQAVLPIEELDSARALIHFLRIQQHDFMNHMQVIHGYLQLSKPQRAMEYIEDIITQRQNLSSIYKLADPEMAACLITGITKAAFHQVDLEFLLESQWSLRADSRRIAGLCTEILHIIIEMLAKLPGKTLRVRLLDNLAGHIFQLEIPGYVDTPHFPDELEHLATAAVSLGCKISYHHKNELLVIVCEIFSDDGEDRMQVAEKS